MARPLRRDGRATFFRSPAFSRRRSVDPERRAVAADPIDEPAMTEPVPQFPPSRLRFAGGEFAVAVGLIAFAVVVMWQTFAIPVSPLYSKVGPTIAPHLNWIFLLVLGLGLLGQALRGGWQSDEEKESPVDFIALGFVAAGLAANVLLIEPAGFTIASVAMFVLVARGFGSQRWLRNAGIAFVLALVAHLGFAGLLGIDIGGGIVENAVGSALGIVKG